MAVPEAPRIERTRKQKLADAALVQHPHRLELRGAPESLAWPSICANCGSATAERLRVRKAFYPHQLRTHRHASGFGRYKIHSVDIPFCPTCIDEHHRTMPHVSAFATWRSFLLNPAHIATIGFAWLLVKIAPDTLAGASDPAGRTAALAIVGGLTLGLLWTPVVVWWSTRPDRLPPRSDITKACDFSGNVAEFESERHIYALRNKTFADALAAANPDRVWTAGDQKRMRSRTAIISAVLLAALLVARLLMWYFTGK